MESRRKKALATVVDLPQELVLEIHSWLPVQSLWRFKSVCKAWCNRVDNDPAFAKLHLDRAIAAPGNQRSIVYQRGIVCDTIGYKSSIYQMKPPLLQEGSESQKPTELLLYDCPLPYGSCLIGCCNGLLCFRSYGNEYDVKHVVLVNPSTRRLKLSPREECVREPCGDGFVAYGFGYDSATDDYKVVRIRISIYRPRIFKWDVRVYSMNRNSWRKVVNGYTPDSVLAFEPGIFFNGSIHWMTYNAHPSAIISFDVKDDEFQRVLLPPYCGDNTSYCHLMIMRECLGMVRTNYSNGDWEVWLMMEYGRMESWTKQVVIRRNPEFNVRPQYCSVIGNQILFRVGNIDGKMVMYDMKAKKTDIDIKAANSPIVSTISCVESLVSLKSREPSTAYLEVQGQDQ